jgi:hypothetical protein|tara:strand:+ start:392 stop:748 length:357 start_codon:yes stop_codon:yes gene_type:complete
MKKGDLVKVKDAEFKHFNNPAGFRPTTQEERDEWRAELTRDIQAGLTEWHDSGGEPKLAPETHFVHLKEGATYLVLRARAHARVGWSNGVPKCSYLVCPSTGEQFYMPRADLEVVSER